MPTTPDYIRIADLITSEVKAGNLKPGDKLPSIAELCVHYDVSPSTIKSTFIRLEALELIVRRQGKGVFIAGEIPERFRQS